MKNIYLTGFMATGKTTVGEILSSRLGREFVEMDAVIEKAQGCKITDIFKNQGEARFRQLESELLLKLSKRDGLIISCGGGLICNEQNLQILKKGLIFCLESSAEAIYERTKGYENRPLLNVEKPLEEIRALLRKREPFYRQADYMIKSEQETPAQVADNIINFIEKDG